MINLRIVNEALLPHLNPGKDFYTIYCERAFNSAFRDSQLILDGHRWLSNISISFFYTQEALPSYRSIPPPPILYIKKIYIS